MMSADTPLAAAVDALDPEGLIRTGDYVVQGTSADPKLQFPQLSYTNDGVDQESEFTCFWDSLTGVLIYVPVDSDVDIQ